MASMINTSHIESFFQPRRRKIYGILTAYSDTLTACDDILTAYSDTLIACDDNLAVRSDN
jgi:hypothetical protein